MILLCSCITKELSWSKGGAPWTGGQMTSFIWSWGVLGKMPPLMGTKGQGGGFWGSHPLYSMSLILLGGRVPQEPSVLVSETPLPGPPQPRVSVVLSALSAETIRQCPVLPGRRQSPFKPCLIRQFVAMYETNFLSNQLAS